MRLGWQTGKMVVVACVLAGVHLTSRNLHEIYEPLRRTMVLTTVKGLYRVAGWPTFVFWRSAGLTECSIDGRQELLGVDGFG